MKVCSKCGQSKPDTDYSVIKRDADGKPLKFRAQCRACAREVARLYQPSAELRALGPDRHLRVGPFRDWCLMRMEQDEIGVGTFAARVGIPERRLNDHLNGRTRNIASRIVDRALTRDGGWHISQLYPSLYPGAPQPVIELLQAAARTEAGEAWETEHNQEGRAAA